MPEKWWGQADPATMNTSFFGEILSRERISFCARHSMYKTKFGHRISGSKISPAGKTAGQAQFDFHFSSV